VKEKDGKDNKDLENCKDCQTGIEIAHFFIF